MIECLCDLNTDESKLHLPPKLGSKSKTSFDDFQEQQPLCAVGVYICCALSLLHFATLNRCHHPSQETRKPRKVALCNLQLWKRQTAIKEARLLQLQHDRHRSP